MTNHNTKFIVVDKKIVPEEPMTPQPLFDESFSKSPIRHHNSSQNVSGTF